MKLIDRWNARLERACERHRRLAFGVAVFRRFGTERGANLAAAISMRGFLARFPVLVLAIAVVGFIGGDPRAIADNRVHYDLYKAEVQTAPDTSQGKKFPQEVVGEIRVLRTEPHSATCLVTQSRLELEPGDTLVARRGY